MTSRATVACFSHDRRRRLGSSRSWARLSPAPGTMFAARPRRRSNVLCRAASWTRPSTFANECCGPNLSGPPCSSSQALCWPCSTRSATPTGAIRTGRRSGIPGPIPPRRAPPRHRKRSVWRLSGAARQRFGRCVCCWVGGRRGGDCGGFAGGRAFRRCTGARSLPERRPTFASSRTLERGSSSCAEACSFHGTAHSDSSLDRRWEEARSSTRWCVSLRRTMFGAVGNQWPRRPRRTGV